jgi:peroxiredoxin
MANPTPSESRNKATDSGGAARAPRLRRALLPVALIAAFGIALPLGLKLVLEHGDHSGAPGAKLQAGMRVPEFQAPRLGGGQWSRSDRDPKVLLVNFWATWCEACIVEMPSLVEVYRDFHDRGFEVLAVSVDESAEPVGPLAEKLDMRFPIALDPQGKLSEIFGVSAIPLTVVLDRQGKALLIHRGERDWNSSRFRSQLETWLAAE